MAPKRRKAQAAQVSAGQKADKESDLKERSSASTPDESQRSSLTLRLSLILGLLTLVLASTILRRFRDSSSGSINTAFEDAYRDHVSLGTDVDTEVEARDASIFEVRDLPGRGKGVIAVRDIKQGQLIIREKPLFVLPAEVRTSPTALLAHHLRALPPRSQERFFNLSYVHFPPPHLPLHIDPSSDEYKYEKALAIFQTNAVAASLTLDGGRVPGVGIFPRMARLNHGCSSAFNVVYTWREKEEVLVVHALKDVKKGEELLTTYTDTKKPRDQRRAHLSTTYAFHCTCAVCSLPDAESVKSDRRLERMGGLYGEFKGWGWGGGGIDGVKAIGIAREIWELGTQEGYWSERGRLAADAAWVCAAHSDALRTSLWARLAAEWYTYEIGEDSEQVTEMRRIEAKPESHMAWGTRERMDVPGPEGL